MSVQIGAPAQPGFDQPLALMMDCHRRIEHFLCVLSEIARRYHGGELDGPARQSLDTALTYFQQAAPRHTADEERSLFPRLRLSDDPAVRQAMVQIDRLEADHREAEAAHARIDALGRAWLRAGRLDADDAAALRALLDRLGAVYAAHIRLEDERVFVLARRALDAEALRAVGEEMKQRRIDDPGREGSRCAERRRQQFTAARRDDRDD